MKMSANDQATLAVSSPESSKKLRIVCSDHTSEVTDIFEIDIPAAALQDGDDRAKFRRKAMRLLGAHLDGLLDGTTESFTFMALD